ncbi:MAG: class I SAM-dependent methyltransferase [Gammaproteobacteria bacterium]|nr:class I SAM-dependent methyltransferase [Gammaproteobacteria bacterium]
MNNTHGLMPETSHDERSRLAFIVDLKGLLDIGASAANAELLAERVMPKVAGQDDKTLLQRARSEMARQVPYQHWMTLMRSAQEMMWHAVGNCVDRQYEDLEARAEGLAADRAVRTVPDFTVPPYLTAVDTHLMPGSYYTQRSDTDIRQGAVFDLAAAIYHRGRNGNELNDIRGHTIVSHLWERFPELEPENLLELGCTVGHSTVAVARYFADAELHAVDIGLPVLRYAQARARSLGVDIHFAQENAETLSYPDESFDVVYSSVMLHETSNSALPNIMAECYRVLRPGGVVIHLEVPVRYAEMPLADQLRADYETYYNNEPFWRGACTADLVGALRTAGFVDVAEGYQQAVTAASRDSHGFSSERGPVYRCWYIVSGRKP